MADKPIYLPISPNAETWKWGTRHYFYNCHREGGDYDWFADNLTEAEGSPRPESIDAKWTFGGRWDPEGTMPSVLPYVSQPSPRNGSYRVPATNVAASWIPSRNAEASIAYYSKEVNLERVAIQSDRSFRLGALEPKTRYYWRIDEIVNQDTVKGPLWHFTTQ
jgi:hypothetical protein